VGSEKPLIAVDPGHGGSEIGAAYSGTGGLALLEKDVNLAIARRLKALLEAGGYRVLLTREGDVGANLPAVDRNGDGTVDTQDDLQARIDKANEAGATLLLSVHNNGHPSPDESGSEVYYCEHRPYAERSIALAEGLQAAFVRRLGEVGYATRDRGAKGDTNFRVLNGVPQHASLLGPPQPPRILRASQMPAALGESLFLSHAEGALLAREDVQQAIAQAYFDAIDEYFQRYPAP
jgi:N-acetylmuramoyl-L-alanine amidase